MPQYQGVWNLQDAARLQSQQQWVTDPNFRSTTLLLQADNAANGAQNNTFLDSSSNNFAITRNGNTTQGTFTPFSQGWSVFLDASGDYVDGSVSMLGGSNVSTFTIDGWIYPTSFASTIYVIGDMQATAGLNYISVDITTGGLVRLGWFDGASKTCTSTGTLSLNQWNYFAISVSSNAITIYVNSATSGQTGTTTLTNRTGTLNFSVGAFNGSGTPNSYLSNLRVSTIARTISVPTTAFANDADTRLLLFQSNRFVNNGSTSSTLTPFGNSSVQPFAPFAPQFQYTQTGIGGSGYFDGTGDFLSFTGSIAISGQFAAECWFYRLTSAGQQQTLFAFNSTNTSYASIRVDTDGNGNNDRNITANLSTNGTSWASTIAINSIYSKFGWNHVLVTRDGSNNVRVFLNGVLINTPSAVSGALFSTSTTHSIGCNTLPGTAANLFTGYISDVRLVNGSIPTTYQTSSTTSGTTIFTPPSAPLTTSSQGATSGNVTLLTNFTNAGIIDGTMDNVLETLGNAQVSTSVVKYGSGSMAFDGTGDYLVIPDNPRFNLGSGNFTIEMWAYRNNAANPYALFGKRNNSSADFRWISSYINTSGTVNVELTTTGSSWAISTATTSTVPVATWTHIAYVRNSADFSVYVNGVKNTLSTSLTGSIFTDTNPLVIGQTGLSGSFLYPLNGYLDDFRITTGVARYLSNFTPPQVALPRQ